MGRQVSRREFQAQLNKLLAVVQLRQALGGAGSSSRWSHLRRAEPQTWGWVGNSCCETIGSNLHSRHFSSKMIGALRRYVIAGLNTLDSYRSPDSRRPCQSFSMSLQEPATLSGLHQQRFS